MVESSGQIHNPIKAGAGKELAKIGEQRTVNRRMHHKSEEPLIKTGRVLPTLWMTALLLSTVSLSAQEKPAVSTPASAAPQPAGTSAAVVFDGIADIALLAMKKRAEELNIKGVAVVAYAPGDTVESWSSKMLVVGHLKNLPTQGKKGDNLLGIAYTKAAEMADTLKDSGSNIRPPMTGEYGWQGGVVAKGKTGIVIAAFSGGSSADDVKASRAGLEILAGGL
jgi:hypothetical protein